MCDLPAADTKKATAHQVVPYSMTACTTARTLHDTARQHGQICDRCNKLPHRFILVLGDEVVVFKVCPESHHVVCNLTVVECGILARRLQVQPRISRGGGGG